MADAPSSNLTALTWNCEGVKANIYTLKHFLVQHTPDLCFLSEPQLFSTDADLIKKAMAGEYCFFLNSEDLYEPDLPLKKSRTFGGTLCLWKRYLDPYITVAPPVTPSVLVLALKLPNHCISVHIAIYLPTHGKDNEYVAALGELDSCIDNMKSLYPTAAIFVRGDANTSAKNKKRNILFAHLLRKNRLSAVDIHHKTYHHFTGHGSSDSNLDVLLYPSNIPQAEKVCLILCKHEHPSILSHHDVILSSFKILNTYSHSSGYINDRAPRISIERVRINWTQEGIQRFSFAVTPILRELRNSWLDSSSISCTSTLLDLTNKMLVKIATLTNTSKHLGKDPPTRPLSIPKNVRRAQHSLRKISMKQDDADPSLLQCAKANYRRAVRRARLLQDCKRDLKLSSLVGETPAAAFKFIRQMRQSAPVSLSKLSVNGVLYEGDCIPDGFYNSMSSIKTYDIDALQSDPMINERLSNYSHISKLCLDKQTLPPISLEQSNLILKRMKPKVHDIYNISASHYINAGDEGLLHFNIILNAVIQNVNSASLDELNLALGIILYKGHSKDKTSDRSYRTITSCPFIAKAVDLYIRDLFKDKWDAVQSATQYQGSGSSHELAALLLTEVIQFSLYQKNQPVYILALDAQSAFDRCLRQIIVEELYRTKVCGSALTFIDSRLHNRSTIYQWDNIAMGPSKDDTGVEQGGINSSEFYKLYNNEQLDTAQRSELGVNIESSTVSSIGQADDVLLVASTVNDSLLLTLLTEKYCHKYHVKLVPSKTKLLGFAKPSHQYLVDHAKLVNQISIDNEPVLFSQEVEHVGIIRNVDGNLPNILNRISAHKKSIGALLPLGLSRNQRSSPSVSLRIHNVYCAPILFSGLASLVLSPKEIQMIDSHFLDTLRNLQRLHRGTPRAIVLFMAGSLPGQALLHIRQLTLFLMICHKPDNPLNSHALYILTHPTFKSHSWFLKVLAIFKQYGLPHPLHYLKNPPKRSVFKSLVKKKVRAYWTLLLTSEIADLRSTKYFQPSQYSLHYPWFSWQSVTGNSYECAKSLVVAKMISGCYRT